MKRNKLLSIMLAAIVFVMPFTTIGFGFSTPSYSMDILSSGLNQSINVVKGPDGKLYISEYGGGNIIRIDRDGQNKEVFATGLIQPIGMFFDGAGNMFVAEHSGAKILKIEPDGSKSTIKSGVGLLTGLVIDSENKIYANDYGSGKILKMNLDGSDLTEFVTGLNTSTNIGMTIDSNDNIYISDRQGGKVKKVEPNGVVTDLISNLSSPNWVTLGKGNCLYVSSGSRKIEKFDLSGNKISEFLTATSVGMPWGTAIDETGAIYYETLGSGCYKIIGSANTIDKTHILLTLNTTLAAMTLDPAAFSITGAVLEPMVTQATTSGSSIYLTLDKSMASTDTNLKVSYSKTGVSNMSTLGSAIEVDNFINMPVSNQILSVTSIESVQNINVNFSTDLNTVKAQLPSNLTVTLSDSTTTSAAITWNDGSPLYTGNVVGNYIFNGTFPVATNVSNPNNLTASATVVVSQPQLSSDATLSGIGLSAGTLVFESGKKAYTINVPYSTEVITIAPVANESHATIRINGNALINGNSNLNLNVGSNSTHILVTAQDGITTETYTLTIIRAVANDANLSNLAISTGVLSPSFNSEILNYSARVPNIVTNISVTPTLSDHGAQVAFNGVLVSSGESTAPIALNVGANEIPVAITAADGITTKTYMISIQRETPTVVIVFPETPKVETPDNSVIILVNGQELSAGKETKSTEGGQTVVTVEMDNKVIENKIEEVIEKGTQGKNNVIQVPVLDLSSDITRVQLTGDIVKKLEKHAFKVAVIRGNVEYVIPAEEFTISEVAQSLSVPEKDLQDIKIEVKITTLSQLMVSQFNKVAQSNGSELLFPPTAFEVVAKTMNSNGTTQEVEINKFRNYVERIMEVPANVDPMKVTTGIVFSADGTYSHVPTELVLKNGEWFARLSSLTNSTYALIYNPMTVKSVEKHWSKNAVNEMASRLVVFNPETFNPEKEITRSEFAEYLVRALGLYKQGLKMDNVFNDLDETSDRATSILIANEYGLVTGYSDGTFKPDSFITREEAMVMYHRAMKVSKLFVTNDGRYEMFTDFDTVSIYAREAVKEVLSARIFNGSPNYLLSPSNKLTHAEAIQAINNLLVSAKLINK